MKKQRRRYKLTDLDKAYQENLIIGRPVMIPADSEEVKKIAEKVMKEYAKAIKSLADK